MVIMEIGARRRNWRLVIVGIVVIAAAAGFFGGMQTMAPSSNDPITLMRTVGQVAGAVGALGLSMLIFGLIGSKK